MDWGNVFYESEKWRESAQELQIHKLNEWMRNVCVISSQHFSEKWCGKIIHRTWIHFGVSVRECDHIMPSSMIDTATSLKFWPVLVWFVIVCIGLTTHKHTNTHKLNCIHVQLIALSGFIQMYHSLSRNPPNRVFSANCIYLQLNVFRAHLFQIYDSIRALSIFYI